MTHKLRISIVKKPDIQLEGEVKSDEIYLVCGHKGQQNKVQ